MAASVLGPGGRMVIWSMVVVRMVMLRMAFWRMVME
jgi:hypothetical protein